MASDLSLRAADILESITDAFFALDRDWRLTYVNDQANRLMTKKREQILGRTLWEAYPQLLATPFEREYRRAMEEGVTVAFEEFYAPLDAWLEVRAYPSADGLSVFYQDVSARKRAEEALSRSQADLRLAVNAAQLGTFYCDWPLDKIVWNDICKAHFFLPPDAEVDFTLFYSLLHPEDREPTRQAIDRAFAQRAEYNVEYRTLSADGRTRWVNAVGRFYYDDAGEPVRFDGVTRDISERKALEEERERLARREHNIARQLQEALQPELPDAVPGLAVTKHYEAALAEAGVGGDFCDVFRVEKGRTALVVGDLSGKGLAAAAQVSTVRNMLRAFLYTHPTVDEAVARLNRVLTENNLLTGFATLWVSCHDAAAGVISYVNCGQEPALLRQAGTGKVEQLPPTGPVLGAMENAVYEERQVAFFAGDALAVFTDGATECGLSRRRMLGIAGVTKLMGPSFAPEDAESAERTAQALAGRLAAGVDAASRGGVARDDICILVAVAR